MPAEHSGVNWTTHRAYDNFRGALSARMLGVIFQRLLYWEKKHLSLAVNSYCLLLDILIWAK